MRYHENQARKKGHKVIAGIDEAGRGPLAGPVVASCCVLKKKRFSSLIRDSKTLTPKQRELAYREVTEYSSFTVGIVDEKIIDKVNIYQATILAVEETVRKFKSKPDFILVDGRMKLNITPQHKCIKRGDQKSVSIAAASIIAKVTRDRMMLDYDLEYPEYGFAKHKGYPTKDHIRALKKHGPSPIHRLTFRHVK